MKLTPKKSLGQHFLVNKGVIEKIIDACQLTKEDIVVEIGPGTGVLTKRIVSSVGKTCAIEKDRVLAQKLEEEFKAENAEIICEDILKFSFDKINRPIKLIGNLPYYISTPILEKIIENREKFSDVFIMVQWEYGQRLVAQPNSKAYGSLSCFAQLFTEPKILFKISPGSFNPPPKVHSCFMHLKLLPQTRFPHTDTEWLFKVIHAAFAQRRKTLQNTLGSLVSRAMWEELSKVLKIDPKLRAENVSLVDFVRLAEWIKKQRQG